MRTSVVVRDACAWPVLVRLSPSRLGLIHFNRPSHGLEEGDLAALASDDEGHSWQNAGLAAPHGVGANRMHIASGLDHAGRWLVLSTGYQVEGGALRALDPVWCSIANATALEWSVQRDVRLAGVAARPIPHGRILALPDGRLAATVYRSLGRGEPSHAWIVFSRDGGASWGEASLVAGGDGNEVVLLRRRDGALLAATRTHRDHHVALHISNDGGARWRFHRDLTLPMQHPADLTDLGERGLLLTYGIRTPDQMGLGVRLSRDGGETWSAPAVLFQFGAATDCGYPSTVVISGGELLTACYSDLSPLHRGYHLMTLRWNLDEVLAPHSFRLSSAGVPRAD